MSAVRSTELPQMARTLRERILRRRCSSKRLRTLRIARYPGDRPRCILDAGKFTGGLYLRSFIACLFLTLLAVSADAADEWAPFLDPFGNFRVEFQRLPRAATTRGNSLLGENVPMAMYSVQDGPNLMMVEDVPVLDRASPSSEVVDRFAKRILAEAASKSNIVQSDMTDMLDGQLGRRLSILRPDGNLVTARVFYFNAHVYWLGTITQGGNPARTADALHFSESLHLTAQQPQ